MKTFILVLVVFFSLPFVLSPLNAQWQQLSGPDGAQVFSMTAQNSDVYLGTTGGVYYSIDQGLNWSFIGVGLTNSFVQSVLSDGSTILAGTSFQGGATSAVHLTNDGGGSWSEASVGLTGSEAFAFAKLDTNYFVATNTGVFRADESVSLWTEVNNGLPPNFVNGITALGQNLYCTIYTQGVYQSTDRGNNWTQVNNGLTSTSVGQIISANGDLFVAANPGGVFRSTDNGANWTAVNTGISVLSVSALAALGTELLCRSEGGVYYSSNSGGNWTVVNTGLGDSSAIRALAITATHVFAGGLNGMFVSTDRGASWTAGNSGLRNVGVTSAAILGSTFFVGLTRGGIYESDDVGMTWNPVNSGFPIASRIDALHYHGSDLLASANSSVRRSTDGGTTWTKSDSGLGGRRVRGFLSLGSDLLAVNISGDTSVHKSTDGGMSWASSIVGLPSFVTINSIYGHSSGVYVGTGGSGVYKSTDSGATWAASNGGITTAFVSTVTALGQDLLVGTTLAVFRSTDNGANWAFFNSGIIGSNSISLVKGNDTVAIAVGRPSGIYVRSTSMSTWKWVQPGLPQATATSLISAFFVPGEVIVGTTAHGMWRRPIDDLLTSVGESGRGAVPSDLALYQNYPNPFNPATTIRYALPVESHVTLTVYDLLGRRIAVLLDERQTPGEKVVAWNGDGYPSGVYFYRLATMTRGAAVKDHSNVQTRRMVLLK